MIIVKTIFDALLPEILTQPVAPPRGHHRNGQERCPKRLEECYYATNTFGRMFIV